METKSIKAISMRLLQGNRQGNQKETFNIGKETLKETERLFRGVVEIITATGRKVCVVTDDRAATLAPEGAALFTRQEIEAMKGVPREMVERVIDVKEIFPGAEIERN